MRDRRPVPVLAAEREDDADRHPDPQVHPASAFSGLRLAMRRPTAPIARNPIGCVMSAPSVGLPLTTRSPNDAMSVRSPTAKSHQASREEARPGPWLASGYESAISSILPRVARESRVRRPCGSAFVESPRAHRSRRRSFEEPRQRAPSASRSHPSGFIKTSQKTNPARRTISPTSTRMGREKIGPSNTSVWNSPFSPHGSTPSGRSRRSDSSK